MFLFLLINILLWRKLKNYTSGEDLYDFLILLPVSMDQMTSLNWFLLDPEHFC